MILHYVLIMHNNNDNYYFCTQSNEADARSVVTTRSDVHMHTDLWYLIIGVMQVHCLTKRHFSFGTQIVQPERSRKLQDPEKPHRKVDNIIL